MTLEPSEKQKKILAAKKKLKSFQAKRAAASPSQAGDSDGHADEASQAATPSPATPTQSEADAAGQTPAPAPADGADAANGLSLPRFEDVDVLSKELEQLKLQINEQREQLKAENKKSRADLQGCQAKLAELEVSSAAKERELHEQLDDNKQAIQLAAEQAALDRASIEEANTRAQSLEEETRSLRVKFDADLRDAADRHAQQLSSRESELLGAHKSEVEELTAQLSQRDSDIADLHAAAADASSAHNAELARLAMEAKQAAKAAEADAERYEQELKEVTSKLDTATEHAQASDAQCKELGRAKSELTDSVRELEIQVSDAKSAIKTLDAQLQQANDAHVAAEAESRAQHESLGSEIAAKSAIISQLESRLEQASASAAALESQLAEQRETNDILTNRLSEAQSERDGESSKRESLEHDLAARDAAIVELTTKSENLESSAALLQKQIDGMQQENAEKDAQWADREGLLTRQLADLRSELDESAESHREEVASLNEKLNASAATRKELEAAGAELRTALAAEAADGKEKQQRIEVLESDVAHVGQMRDNIQAKHDGLVAAQKKSRKSIDRLTHERSELSKSLEVMEKLKNEISTQAEADGEAHAQQKAALEAELAAAKQESSTLLEELASLRTSHEDLQIEAQAAKETFEELAQEHSDLENSHGALKARCNHLTKQLDKAITSTRAWITELHDASTRHKEELEGWELSESL
ncbi:hypothetical protein GQ54DRAFT_94316 [Martensiomyces pterosporus]|nr:hypothetical protein GQ54DRAFT_94316 [Martensiomyces pterosporus]